MNDRVDGETRQISTKIETIITCSLLVVFSVLRVAVIALSGNATDTATHAALRLCRRCQIRNRLSSAPPFACTRRRFCALKLFKPGSHMLYECLSIWYTENEPRRMVNLCQAFGEYQGSRIIEQGTLCKMARGQTVRRLAASAVTSAAAIKHSGRMRYAYHHELSSEHHFVLIKGGTKHAASRYQSP